MTRNLHERLSTDNHVCPWWLAFTFDNPLRPLLHDPDKMLRGLVAPGQTAIDLGCGMGYFSVALARLVGENGRVVAVDLQDKMLQKVERRAQRAGVERRIRLHQCQPNHLGISESADFVLAFWMMHEVPDKSEFLRQVRGLLKPKARLLIVEPKLHVSASSFQKTIDLALANGFELTSLARLCPAPFVRLSRAALFELAK